MITQSRLFRSRSWPGLWLFLLPAMVLTQLPGLAAAGVRTARLVIHSTGVPFAGATLFVLPPGDAPLLVHCEELTGRPARVGPFPPGAARLELHDADGRLLRTWSVLLAASLTTVVSVDAGEGTLAVSAAHPDPFGNAMTLGFEELAIETLAGHGALVGLDAGQSGSLTQGVDRRWRSRLRALPPGGTIEGVGLQSWRGALPPSRTGAKSIDLAHRAADTGAWMELSAGSSGRFGGTASGRVQRRLGSLGPVELRGSLRGWQHDQGFVPVGGSSPEGNDLETIETRIEGFLHPADLGVARVAFVAAGQSRHHYLHEFSRNAQHNPREDKGALAAALDWDLPLWRADLSLGVGYDRAYSETGDGRAFDRITNYRIGSIENDAATDDGLYWWGGTRFSSRPAHLYNYYTQDLTTAWTLRAESQFERGTRLGLRAGFEADLARWRWYEHLDPIADAQIDPDGTNGFWYASYLGYSRDGQERDELPGHASPRPRTLRGYVTRGLSIGPATVGAGVRWTSFQPDQRAVRDFTRPLGADTLLTDDDFEEVKDRSWTDPSLGLHLALGSATHLWLDGGRESTLPPYEALYLSPNVLAQQASFAAQGPIPHAEEYIFGHAALDPARRDAVHLGLLHAPDDRWDLRLTGTMARTRDTWVAAQHLAGGDTLYRYENRGERRERGVRIDLTTRPGSGTVVRASYALARLETDVIEPAPLYRGLILPDAPVESSGLDETAPLATLWSDDGTDRDWFPSIFDRTHRFTLTWTTQVGSDPGSALPSALRRTQLAAVLRAASGRPYTPTYTRA